METREAAQIFKALSHPNRLELFIEILRCGEKGFEDGACVISDIARCFQVGAPTISHHLKELSGAGLIETERRGKFLVARADRARATELLKLFTGE